MESATDDVGLCWGCGYALRGIESRRCPECGREFDPGDARSTNRGRVMGRLGRALIRPVSPLLVFMGLVGALLVMVVSRLPVYGLQGWFVDLPYYLKWGDWKERFAGAGWRDGVYLCGLLVWGLVVLAWWVGTAVRWVALRRYRVPAGLRVRVWRRHLLLLLLMLLTVGMVGAGWPYRLGMAMVTREFGAEKGLSQSAEDVLPEMSVERRRGALWSAVLYGHSQRERLMALRVLIEEHTDFARTVLEDALRRESDPVMKAWELRLGALYHGPGWAEVVGKYLDDPDAGVRAAAADGVGLVYGGLAAGQLETDGYSWPTTKSDPPIGVAGRAVPYEGWHPEVMSESWKGRLAKMMTEGQTQEEREAAARAISGRGLEKHRLRLAEWGVWMIDGSDGRLSSELSDLPPIVHQVGDSIAAITQQAFSAGKRRHGKNVPGPMVILKPVIHLTASAPMSVDIGVSIEYGRPWYVYPRPDDFIFERSFNPPQSLKDQDPTGLAELGKALRPGYPWLEPANRNPRNVGMLVLPTSLSRVGFRWQSLIVSPTKLSWMTPAEVGGDAHFAWWKRLREVDCSWVSNGGESERFLYYDGPTALRSPVTFAVEKGKLLVRRTKLAAGEMAFGWTSFTPENVRDGLLLTVKSGQVRAERFTVPIGGDIGPRWPIVPELKDVGGKGTEAFLKCIMAHGLTESEAKGMMECWRKPFLETDGVRVLMLLSAADYEEFCPMAVRPVPTEKARVGVIWCELE